VTSRREGLAWAALAALLAAAVYEALVALKAIPMGKQPGDGPPGGTFFSVCAAFAFLLAIGLCVARAFAAAPGDGLVWAALAPAGFALLLARWLTFDPYYLPSLRRYTEGEIHALWIAIVGAASLVAALLSWRLPRVGTALASVVLVVTALTAWFLPLGK